MIKIEVQSTRAVIRSQEPLTVGLRGAKAYFAFGMDWTELTKTAVFRQGDKAVAVADIDTEVTIPWEVLTQPGLPVQIGVYGIDSAGNIAIPTVWAVTKRVLSGTTPEADPSTEPTPGLWEQMQGKLSELEEQLRDNDRTVYLVTVWKNDDGSYYTEGSPDDRAAAYHSGRLLMCYWPEHSMLLPVSDPDGGREFVFSAVKDQKEYRVKITSNDSVECSCTPLVSTTVKVTVTQNQEEGYEADRYAQELLDAHNAGHLVYCQHGNRVYPLLVASKSQMIFGCVQAGNVHSVKIGIHSVSVTTTPLTSGTATQEAVLYTPQELSPEQQSQARENIKSTNVFHLTETVEQAVEEYDILLPVDLYDTVVFNIHGIYPQVEKAFKLMAVIGGVYSGMGTIPVCTQEGGRSGSNFYMLKQDGTYHMGSTSVAPDYHNNARYGNANSTVQIPKGSTSIKIVTQTADTTIPAGTVFEIWGVYLQ